MKRGLKKAIAKREDAEAASRTLILKSVGVMSTVPSLNKSLADHSDAEKWYTTSTAISMTIAQKT